MMCDVRKMKWVMGVKKNWFEIIEIQKMSITFVTHCKLQNKKD